jgi:hypothetical protein
MSSKLCQQAVVVAFFLGAVACSGGREPQLEVPVKPSLSALDFSPSISAVPESWANVDWTNPISVMTVPYAGCTIRPQGTTDDRSDFVSASSDAVIRFYPPPSTWGDRLTLGCSTNSDGSSPAAFLVDLSDSSTYFVEPDLLGGPQVIGERPALSGDLLSISATRSPA